jgi:hypothetical protein
VSDQSATYTIIVKGDQAKAELAGVESAFGGVDTRATAMGERLDSAFEKMHGGARKLGGGWTRSARNSAMTQRSTSPTSV